MSERDARTAPVYFLGTGRCGSTLVHRLVCEHPGADWLTPLAGRHPGRPGLNARALTLQRLPVVGKLVRWRLRPSEAYSFWDLNCPGFSRPCRDLVGADLTPYAAKRLRAALGAVAPAGDRPMVIKLTGWSRIGFLDTLTPASRFVYIVRDPRAVISSGMQVRWASFLRGPDGWEWGRLTPAQAELWESRGRSFSLLAAMGWENLLAAYREQKAALPDDRLLELRYEDLCADPIDCMRRVAEFSGLEWSSGFERAVQRARIRSANRKWADNLAPHQIADIEGYLRDLLESFGYS